MNAAWIKGDCNYHNVKLNELATKTIGYMEMSQSIAFGSTPCYGYLSYTIYNCRGHLTCKTTMRCPGFSGISLISLTVKVFQTRFFLILRLSVNSCVGIKRCPNITAKELKIMITERESLVKKDDDEKDEGEEDTDDHKYLRISTYSSSYCLRPAEEVVQTESPMVPGPCRIFPLGVNWNDLFALCFPTSIDFAAF